MNVISSLTGAEYDTNTTVRIFNQKQYAMYVKHGATIVDCGTTRSGLFYLVFGAEATKELFGKWCRRELV